MAAGQRQPRAVRDDGCLRDRAALPPQQLLRVPDALSDRREGACGQAMRGGLARLLPRLGAGLLRLHDGASASHPGARAQLRQSAWAAVCGRWGQVSEGRGWACGPGRCVLPPRSPLAAARASVLREPVFSRGTAARLLGLLLRSGTRVMTGARLSALTQSQ
eukprot:3795656-Prymnesium_polylepis.2